MTQPALVRAPAVALVALLCLAATVAAHGPPPLRDQDTRLLADHNDDCGGDDAGNLGSCSGTHDLIGLDLQEAQDATLGEVVVFRLLLNGGSPGGVLKDTLTFKAGTAAKTLEFRTSNNQAFEGTGFDRVAGPFPINDGTRFAVEGTLKRLSLGVVGTSLSDFDVVASRDSTKGDFMPGTYTTALGPAPVGSGEQSEPASYERPSYTLRGSTYYANAAPPASATVPAGSDQAVPIPFTNLLKNTPQTLTATISGATGATARFQGGASDGSLTFDLAKGAQGTRNLVLRGVEPGASGILTITVKTNLGGLSTHTFPYTVTQASAATSSPSDPGTSPPSATSKANDAPGPGLPVALGLLAFAALRRRS